MQGVIVAIIVLGAAAHLAWHWMPLAWRHAVVRVSAALMARVAPVRAAQMRRAMEAGRTAGACGSCDACGPGGGQAKPAGEASHAIPVSEIGKSRPSSR